MQKASYKWVIFLVLILLIIFTPSVSANSIQQSKAKKVNGARGSRELSGNDLLNNKRYSEAAVYYEQLLRINGPNADNFNHLALAMAGLKAYDQAFRDFSVALSIDPNKTIVYINRGDLWFSLNNFDKAILDYSQAIAIDSSCIKAYDARAKTYNLTGQYQKAIADYSKLQIIDALHTGIYLDNRAYSYRKSGNYRNAIKDMTEAISRDPKISLLYLDRAAIFVEINQTKESLADCNKAIQMNPTNKAAFLARANSYLRLGDLQKAMTDCNYVKGLLPNKHEASLLLSISAAVMNRQGEPNKAIELAGQAINLDPNLANGYLEHALAGKRLQQYNQAVEDCNKVISINSKMQEAYVCRAEALEHLAAQDRKIACQLKPAP